MQPLLTDNLHEDPLTATSIKLTVKNSFPWTEIEFALRERDNDFPPHHLSLQMSIAVVFTGLVMSIHRPLRGQPFQEIVVVLQQTGLVVIDVHTGRDMHRIHEHEALAYSALLYHCLDVGRDIEVSAPGLGLEPEFFSVGLHDR